MLLSSMLESPRWPLNRGLPLWPFRYSSTELKALLDMFWDRRAPMDRGLFLVFHCLQYPCRSYSLYPWVSAHCLKSAWACFFFPCCL